MKSQLVIFLLGYSLILASCSLNRNNLSSVRVTSQQMITCQELLKPKPVNDHLTNIDHPFSVENNFEIDGVQNKDIESIMPVEPKHHINFAKRKQAVREHRDITKTVVIPAFDRTMQKMVQVSASNHHTTYYPRALLRRIYLAIWLICLVAAIILLLLTSAFSTPFLSLLLGALLVITIGGFLVFFSLWIWKKNN